MIFNEVIMKNILLVFIIVILSASALTAAPQIAGVSLEDKVIYDNYDYKLKGAGIRKKLVLKLYVGSLYTNREAEDTDKILKGPVASVIRLDIISGIITSKLMKETVQEGFDKAMDGDTSSLQNEIDNFIAVFSEEINKGDQFTFVSLPGVGVTAYKGSEKLTVILNDKFREVLFSIWLGNDPADKKLKKKMMGN